MWKKKYSTSLNSGLFKLSLPDSVPNANKITVLSHGFQNRRGETEQREAEATAAA